VRESRSEAALQTQASNCRPNCRRVVDAYKAVVALPIQLQVLMQVVLGVLHQVLSLVEGGTIGIDADRTPGVSACTAFQDSCRKVGSGKLASL